VSHDHAKRKKKNNLLNNNKGNRKSFLEGRTEIRADGNRKRRKRVLALGEEKERLRLIARPKGGGGSATGSEG